MNTAAALSDTFTAAPFARPQAETARQQQARRGTLQRSTAGLASHLQACTRARSRWFGVQSAFESVHAAVTPRFFTTILVASALIGLLIEWV